jgi:eukaryotic-like serine/threonine-protein kinase
VLAQQNCTLPPELGVEREIVGEVSLFHSKSGLHCVRGLVSIALGDVDGANRATHALVSQSQRQCDNPDLTLGTASMLIGFAELVEALPIPWHIDLEPARSRGEEIANELVQLLYSDSIATSTSIPSLGVAHGWGGFLFALLRCAKATRTNPDSIVTEKLSELASLAEPHGGGVRWPVHNTTRATSFMDSWCNGTAGHLLLFALAYDVLRADSFAELVERAAESLWATDAQLGTLCCGLAGIGYAFVAAYRVTGSELWLERAHAVTRRAAADSSKHFFRDALYKGAVGVVVLTEDLKQPLDAAMPLFEPTS